MRQKIDIADVETATKIRAKYLRALENEEFGLLPGPTFVKTFLRTYAEYLGLDAQLLVEEYRVAYEPRGEEVAPIGATSSGRTARRGRGGGGGAGGGRRGVGPPGPGAVFGGIFVLLLAVIIILGLTADEKNGGGDTTQPTEQARDESAAQTRARERAQARRRRAAAKRRRDKAAAARTVRLRLDPSSPVYACVVDGSGKQLFGGTLSEADSFKAKRIRINLGRPDVRVTVSGKRLKIPAGSNPVGYDLRAGRKPRPLPLGQRPNC